MKIQSRQRGWTFYAYNIRIIYKFGWQSVICLENLLFISKFIRYFVIEQK